MSVLAALQGLGSVGVFASRAFLPLFVVALVARFPELITWLPFVSGPPVALSERLAWLTSDAALVTLGVLALVEARAERDPDLRSLLEDVDPAVKAGTAALAAFGFLDSETGALIEHVAGAAPLGLAAARPALAGAVALGVGLAVFALARWRRALLAPVASADGDGALGLRAFVARLEDAWAAGGALLVVSAPLVAVALTLLLLAVAAHARRRIEAHEEAARVACASCAAPRRRAARRCVRCAASCEPEAAPSSAAWPDRWLAPRGPWADGLELLAQGRCPACAEKRDPEELRRASPHGCGWPDAAERAGVPGHDWEADLVRHVRGRAVRLAVLSLVVGLVPVAGAVAALVLGRLRIVTPLRRHVPLGQRLRTRWTVRLLLAALVVVSGVPLVSALTGPAIVGLLHAAWSDAFVSGR